MLYKTLSLFLLLPSTLRCVWARDAKSSGACNNSPALCNRPYNEVTYLGAHDSPFLRNASNDYTAIGDQFFNSSVQLSAGVRLLTAQIQRSKGELHVCHTSCLFLDAGPLSGWLKEIRTWMEANPNEVVTLLFVNGAGASRKEIAKQYKKAGITDKLTYTAQGSHSNNQNWPTLQSMISSGNRLLNFIDVIKKDQSSSAPYIMEEYKHIFENNYDVTSLSGFSCSVFAPASAHGDTQKVLSKHMMPLLNHFVYDKSVAGIEIPAEQLIHKTNAPTGGVGTLGYSADQCKKQWGRNPSYILVDYFNVGPAIKTVDRLNGVTNPVGRLSVSAKVQSAASLNISTDQASKWALAAAVFALAWF